MEERQRNASPALPPTAWNEIKKPRRAKHRPDRHAKLLVLVLLLAGTIFFTPTDNLAVARFGTHCQADFQNNWRDALPYSWDRCGWFVDELNDTDTSVFYFNLHGSKPRYSTCDSCGTGPDDVSLMYTNTHGGAVNDTDARLVMWDQNIRALSNTDNFRYGDENTGNSIFAQYACETLTNADSSSALINRWRNTFRGGLRIALGSHDKLWDSVTTNECGEDFADNLQDGDSVKWAWFDGNGDWYEDQDVKVLATGTGSTDSAASNSSASRRDGIKWQNFTSFARLRDGSVNWFCSSRIDNN